MIKTKGIFALAAVLLSTSMAPAHAKHNHHHWEDRLKKLETDHDTLMKKMNHEDRDLSVKVGGRVKLDTMFDGGARGGVFGLDVTQIPIKGVDVAARKTGHFNFGLMGSQVKVEATKNLGCEKVRAYVETDFRKDSSTSTDAYSIRLRYAYMEYKGLLLGQTSYHFQDAQTFADTVDNLFGVSFHAMARYKFKISDVSYFSVALERPNTEYVDQNGNYVDNNSGLGKSSLPDLSGFLKLGNDKAFVTLRGIVRQLEIRSRQGDVDSAGSLISGNLNKKITGWGAGISAKVFFSGKSALYGQVNGGEGVGRYIDDSNQAAYFQAPTAASPALTFMFKALKAVNFSAGIEHHWCDKWRSTLTATLTKFYKPNIINFDIARFTKQQTRFIFNTIYKTSCNSELGFEVLHMRRNAGTVNRYYGRDTRGLISYVYKF